MRKGGLSELSSTHMLVVFLIIGLIFLSQAISRQIQKVAELLSQAEATIPHEASGPHTQNRAITGGMIVDAHDN